MTKTISNFDDVIDSRNIIDRIDELNDTEDRDPEEEAELAALCKLRDQADCAPDWRHGETLIRESYFVEYIEELIHDCYDLPKEMESGLWPWRHMQIDYEAAADEAKADYVEVDFDGVAYLIRA